MFTKEEIKEGLDKAYKEAGHNAYFSNGFNAGIRFAESKLYTLQDLIDCCGEVSCEDGTLVGKTPAELYKWIENKKK